MTPLFFDENFDVDLQYIGLESKNTDCDNDHTSTDKESNAKISYLIIRKLQEINKCQQLPPSHPRFHFTGIPTVITPTDPEDVMEYTDQFIHNELVNIFITKNNK